VDTQVADASPLIRKDWAVSAVACLAQIEIDEPAIRAFPSASVMRYDVKNRSSSQ
jgi:hypothetical protein